jgi:Zn-dependent M28 family amino/carboxypeptidase
MVGRRDVEHDGMPDYIYEIGSDKLSSSLRAVLEDQNKKHTGLVLDYKYNDPNDPNRFYYRSDHYNFAKHGIPVAFFFNGVHEDYHMPGDDVEKIEFDQIQKVGRLVFYMAWEISNREERLKVDSNKP